MFIFQCLYLTFPCCLYLTILDSSSHPEAQEDTGMNFCAAVLTIAAICKELLTFFLLCTLYTVVLCVFYSSATSSASCRAASCLHPELWSGCCPVELLPSAENLDEDWDGGFGSVARVTSSTSPHEHAVPVASSTSAWAHRLNLWAPLTKVLSASSIFYMEAGAHDHGEDEK